MWTSTNSGVLSAKRSPAITVTDCAMRALNRNHIESEDEGMIRNIGSCKYIKADPATMDPAQNGEVKMIVTVYYDYLLSIPSPKPFVPKPPRPIPNPVKPSSKP